jgi:carbamate kinase
MGAQRRRVVVALGGNASYPPTIRGTAEEQLSLMAGLSEHLVHLINTGCQLVLTHGNGPVVGNILFRMARTASELPPMPMDVCVSHSQGGMGYMLQQSLGNAMRSHGLRAPVVALITQVEVDPTDPAFTHPTKPVGRFFNKEDALRMAGETGWEFVEDSGRGYRRVVASPQPRAIVDLSAVEALLDAGVVPIVAGGGGIPVIRRADGSFHGVPAVIDKDLTSALLAATLGAERLVMLSTIDRVAIDFGKPTQRFIDRMSVSEARRYAAQGQFPPGSMGPKIDAAMRFLAARKAEVVITSLELASAALAGRAGTHIVPDA